jgi:hypothetical protein
MAVPVSYYHLVLFIEIVFMCYYMSYLPLYHLVLFIEIDFYVLLHELSPIIIYNGR